MATIQERLADSLKELQKLINVNGFAVVRSSELSRVHLNRLVRNGFLQEVMKGWYISSRPESSPGDTTNWYISFWMFVARYATLRFGKDWCLSPEQSLAFYSGHTSVPRQVLIRISIAQSNEVPLLHDTSIFYLPLKLANPIIIEPQFGLNLYSLGEALVKCSPTFFSVDSITARSCLSLLPDVSDLLKILLESGQTTKAGRLAGAFRNLGNLSAADQIRDTMKGLGYDIREEDPFCDQTPIPYSRVSSPYAIRIKLMWNRMREVVIANFPKAYNKHTEIKTCIDQLNAQYTLDAYHSLSIEGYRVTDTLIEKIRTGNWKPDINQSDADQKNAMAARGYYQAFESVKLSIERILKGENAGKVAADDLRVWFRELFAPSVAAGLLPAGDLAGYRPNQVYLRGARHTPLSPDAVRDAMPILFELLQNEAEANVRAVLGHFIFVFIHPYMDGNGRIGRFLMNTQLISGGYKWTIIPVERRSEYMAALEKASVEGDITDFTWFIASLLKVD